MFDAFRRGEKDFSPDRDIPSLDGKVIIVTGGNIGLGAESVLRLSKHKPRQVFLAARNVDKANATIKQIKESVPDAPITFLKLDLSDFASIRQATEDFKSQSDRLDILINNAGIMACPPGLTADGYEIQFGTNHVGHALFTKLLMPILKKTAEEPGSDVRVVNLSSAAMEFPPSTGLTLKECHTDMTSTSTFRRYGQSKLANALFSSELARRFPSINCTSPHPGSVQTNLGNQLLDSRPWLHPVSKFMKSILTVPVEKGAENQLWCATAKEVESGAVYYPVGRKMDNIKFTKDETLTKELWDWTEAEFVKKGFGGAW